MKYNKKNEFGKKNKIKFNINIKLNRYLKFFKKLMNNLKIIKEQI